MGSNPVMLSAPAGGTVLFSGNITGTGNGALTVVAPNNIIFSGSDSSAASTNVNGGTLTLSSGTLAGSGLTTVSSGLLAVNKGAISGTLEEPPSAAASWLFTTARSAAARPQSAPAGRSPALEPSALSRSSAAASTPR